MQICVKPQKLNVSAADAYQERNYFEGARLDFRTVDIGRAWPEQVVFENFPKRRLQTKKETLYLKLVKITEAVPASVVIRESVTPRTLAELFESGA